MPRHGRMKWLIAGVALLGSSAANAQEAWTGWRNVTVLYPNSAGFTFLVDGDPLGTNPCGNRLHLPVSQAGNAYDAIVSTIITAFTAGYSMQVVYDTATVNDCDIIINRVYVAKP